MKNRFTRVWILTISFLLILVLVLSACQRGPTPDKKGTDGSETVSEAEGTRDGELSESEVEESEGETATESGSETESESESESESQSEPAQTTGGLPDGFGRPGDFDGGNPAT